MRQRMYWSISATICCMLFNTCCSADYLFARRNPDAQIRVVGDLATWGAGGGGVHVSGAKNETFRVWDWDHTTLEPLHAVELPDEYSACWAGEARYLCVFKKSSEHKRRVMTLWDAVAAEKIKAWDIPYGWYCHVMTKARNGGLIGIALDEEPTQPPPGYEWKTNRLNLGLYDARTESLQWVCIISGPNYGMNIRRALPSDDGRYIAIAGWDNGIALVDVQKKKLLWAKRPPREVSTTCLAFSGDGKYLFSAGSRGCVYTIDVTTGNIIRKSMATLSGRYEYGHRIIDLAASPDGRFVAAGTGPSGLAFLFSAETGKLLEIINHGGSTILVITFSPDSTALATMAAGYIKVWKMPQQPSATSQPVESKDESDTSPSSAKSPATPSDSSAAVSGDCLSPAAK